MSVRTSGVPRDALRAGVDLVLDNVADRMHRITRLHVPSDALMSAHIALINAHSPDTLSLPVQLVCFSFLCPVADLA